MQEKVVKVDRHSDRIMGIKLVLEGELVNIISAYAPQQGLKKEVKEEFIIELEKEVMKMPDSEKIVIGSDLN